MGVPGKWGAQGKGLRQESQLPRRTGYVEVSCGLGTPWGREEQVKGLLSWQQEALWGRGVMDFGQRAWCPCATCPGTSISSDKGPGCLTGS